MSCSKALGTKLHSSTATHSQTDDQSERIIQILEDMLKACMLDFGGNWEKYIPLVMSACNNSYQLTFGMQPFEAQYGRKCKSPICWEGRKKDIANFVQKCLIYKQVKAEHKKPPDY